MFSILFSLLIFIFFFFLCYSFLPSFFFTSCVRKHDSLLLILLGTRWCDKLSSVRVNVTSKQYANAANFIFHSNFISLLHYEFRALSMISKHTMILLSFFIFSICNECQEFSLAFTYKLVYVCIRSYMSCCTRDTCSNHHNHWQSLIAV